MLEDIIKHVGNHEMKVYDEHEHPFPEIIGLRSMTRASSTNAHGKAVPCDVGPLRGIHKRNNPAGLRKDFRGSSWEELVQGRTMEKKDLAQAPTMKKKDLVKLAEMEKKFQRTPQDLPNAKTCHLTIKIVCSVWKKSRRIKVGRSC